VIGEASFNVLRTQEQLGYIVASGVRGYGGVCGVRVIVQSDKSPAYLDERIENFIKITKETIGKMSDEEFKTHVDALVLTKLEEPKIGQRSRLIGSISIEVLHKFCKIPHGVILFFFGTYADKI